jgi:hypothetical protein
MSRWYSTPVFLKAGIVVRVDDFKISPALRRSPGPFDALFDDLGPAHQNGLGNAIVQHP